ncbi:MAG TPA: diguanylate cyclase [Solirubrobacteraceae bacterium]|nr:diguanylate cyclase [Solirubrobacteraceae bacterium]
MTKRFLDALLTGSARAADAVAEDALAGGLDGPAFHARVIAPAMREIGELWAENVLTVSDEHLATAISHEVAARVFAKLLKAAPASREQILLAAVQGEHHVLGLRLVADVLEGAGYEVLYLGADVPAPALLDACARYRPAAVGLTVSMWLNVPTLIGQIEQLHELEPAPRIIVGGRAVIHAHAQGLRAPVVWHADEAVEVFSQALAQAPLHELIDPELAARVPPMRPPQPVGTEALGTIPDAFSATSLEAADAVRAAARHAFEMERLAFRDGLTGLFNRRAFDDRLLALVDDGGSVMLMIDADRFKSINDTFGHEAGDAVLVRIARAILQSVRPEDFAARFGGDEFVVLLPQTNVTEAASIAERIRLAVAQAADEPAVTISLGVAAVSENSRLASQAADRALYRAKEAGRNAVTVGAD